MPRIESVAVVPLGVADTFALSQTYGALRYPSDPFVRKQGSAPGFVVNVTWRSKRARYTGAARLGALLRCGES
jgi:hypothetical protein